jgi:Fe-Mn family superoxide dismutase
MLVANGTHALQHELPKLPYAMDALQPHMSKETVEFHS